MLALSVNSKQLLAALNKVKSKEEVEEVARMRSRRVTVVPGQLLDLDSVLLAFLRRSLPRRRRRTRCLGRQRQTECVSMPRLTMSSTTLRATKSFLTQVGL